jgi:hypothetical protein|tara:strand:+ start:38 stop:289 length:252 start_codon:yes stop_codon:yes gene_type:complete
MNTATDTKNMSKENKFQHYLPQEDEQLRQMVADGCAQWDIASALGRGEVDIYYRRRKLGMPPGPWPKSVKYKRLKEAILQANS